jgi:hypothetical protein
MQSTLFRRARKRFPHGAHFAVTKMIVARLSTPFFGEVRWAVTLTNQNAETVATYELLTMNAM